MRRRQSLRINACGTDARKLKLDSAIARASLHFPTNIVEMPPFGPILNLALLYMPMRVARAHFVVATQLGIRFLTHGTDSLLREHLSLLCDAHSYLGLGPAAKDVLITFRRPARLLSTTNFHDRSGRSPYSEKAYGCFPLAL